MKVSAIVEKEYERQMVIMKAGQKLLPPACQGKWRMMGYILSVAKGIWFQLVSKDRDAISREDERAILYAARQAQNHDPARLQVAKELLDRAEKKCPPWSSNDDAQMLVGFAATLLGVEVGEGGMMDETFKEQVLFHICDKFDGNHPDDVDSGIKQVYDDLATSITALHEAVLQAATGKEAYDINLPYATITRQKSELDAANEKIARLRARQGDHGCTSCPVELREQAKDAEIKRLKDRNESLEIFVKTADVVIDFVQGGATEARIGDECFKGLVDDHKRLKTEVERLKDMLSRSRVYYWTRLSAERGKV